MLSAVIIFGFSIIGCNTNSSDPKNVLMSFIDAIGKQDFEGAKKFATVDSEAMLGMIQMGMSMSGESAKTHTYDKSNMEFGSTTINGDNATVAVKDKRSGEIINYALKKESGAWKVAFDLATMTEIGKAKMKEHGVDGNKMMDSVSQLLNGVKGLEKEAGRLMHDTAK